jgi:hypothetical protein
MPPGRSSWTAGAGPGPPTSCSCARSPTRLRDLNRFFAALLGGRLLPDDLLEDVKATGAERSTYGPGLRVRDTSCGVRVYGNDGDALAYQSWSFSTEDGRRQVTIALTPAFRGTRTTLSTPS